MWLASPKGASIDINTDIGIGIGTGTGTGKAKSQGDISGDKWQELA